MLPHLQNEENDSHFIILQWKQKVVMNGNNYKLQNASHL